MEVMYLILANAALELVPREIWSHPAVRSSAARRGKKPGELLLDVSIHYYAMRKLRDRDKRGRPDIVHTCLLVATSALLAKAGVLRVAVHTYGGNALLLEPDVRLPRNYNRFVGLMEQLLVEGRVPPKAEKPLIRAERMGFEELVEKLAVSPVYALEEGGEEVLPSDLAEELVRHRRPAVVVGAFQRGRLSDDVLSAADKVYTIAPTPLDAWAVVARVISSVEDAVGVYERVWRGEGSTA